MKILMQNKKKQAIYVAIFVVILGVTSWVWLGSSSAPVGDGAGSGLATSTPGNVTIRNLLPYGATINTAILKDKRFQALIEPPSLEVSRDLLGRENPFAAPADTAATIPVE